MSWPIQVAGIKRLADVFCPEFFPEFSLDFFPHCKLLAFSRTGRSRHLKTSADALRTRMPARSCLIDGEAIVCDKNGLAVFDLIRGHRTVASAVHCAFDLLELDGQDLRREPIEKRKALLAKVLRGSHLSIVLNEHYEEDGAIVFREACRLGCVKASSQNGSAPFITPGARRIGSKSKTPRHQP
jgi:ATP dependent DNA ligase-like protein